MIFTNAMVRKPKETKTSTFLTQLRSATKARSESKIAVALRAFRAQAFGSMLAHPQRTIYEIRATFLAGAYLLSEAAVQIQIVRIV